MHTNRVFQLHELLILAFIQHFTHLKVICGFDFLVSQEFPIMHRVLEENQLGCKFVVFHLQGEWPYENYLTSIGLNFLIWKMGIKYLLHTAVVKHTWGIIVKNKPKYLEVLNKLLGNSHHWTTIQVCYKHSTSLSPWCWF